MLKNLIAEMAREGISYKELARIINRDETSVSNKICCKTEFTRREMVEIKKKLFPDCTLDYLFEQSEPEAQ